MYIKASLSNRKEVLKAFRSVGQSIGPDLRKEFRVVGVLLAQRIKAAAPSRRLAATVRPTSTQKGWGVKVGSDAVPWVFPAEFGGTVPLFGGPRRVQYKPFNREGYFIYPTLRGSRDVIQKAADGAIERAINRHFQ